MINSVINKIPYFSGLDEIDILSLTKLFIVRTYKKGSSIFFHGDTGDEMYIIKSGSIKIYRLDSTREIILAILRSGEFFGEMAIMDDNRVRSASAETLEKTELFVLKRKVFHELLLSNPLFMKKVLDVTMERLRRANELIVDLTFLDTRSRICKTLFRLSNDHGIMQRDGLLIDIKLTHQQLAELAGTVRETVTKVLLDLQYDRIISVSEKKILLTNVPKLMNIIENIAR